jgi:hypothetical protein
MGQYIYMVDRQIDWFWFCMVLGIPFEILYPSIFPIANFRKLCYNIPKDATVYKVNVQASDALYIFCFYVLRQNTWGGMARRGKPSTIWLNRTATDRRLI